MKKRSISLVILVFALSAAMIAGPAWAGSAQHNRWKGVAIGVGAAILGSVIYQHHKQSSPRKIDPCPDSVHHRFPPAHHTRGHWVVKKEWIPPTYKEVWNPGHYDRRGGWVEGHWIEIEDKPGYWTERRVWVAGKSGRHGW